MNEFILEDVKTLIRHINNIAIKRGLPYIVSVNHDLINYKSTEEIELKFNYLLHEGDKTAVIVSSSVKAPYDQYLDDKENMIYWANYYLYEDILTHTSFENELNNKNDKYRWN